MSRPETAAAPEAPSRAGPVTAVVCVVLAAILTTPSVVAYWGQRTLNDTQRYVETVEPLVSEPAVQDVIATEVTDVLERQVDIEATLKDVFSDVVTDQPKLERLIPPLAAAINGLIDREVRAFIASDEFADIWVRVNARAQQALHRILEGGSSEVVQLRGDEIVLDLDEVITRVQARLVDRGLTIADRVPIPETDRQVVIAEAPQVRKARTIYAFTNPVSQWLLPAVGVLYLLAFVLARRRPRMGMVIGVLLALNALFLALLLSVGRQLFIDEAAGTQFAPATPDLFDALFAFLERAQGVLLALGVVLAVLGWFASSTRSARAVRSPVAGGLERAGAEVSEQHVSQAGRWVEANVRWLQAGAGAIGFVILFWGSDVTMSRLWWSLAVVLLLLVLLRVLVGAGHPPAAPRTIPDPDHDPDSPHVVP